MYECEEYTCQSRTCARASIVETYRSRDKGVGQTENSLLAWTTSITIITVYSFRTSNVVDAHHVWNDKVENSMANRMRHWQRVRQGSSEETKWRQTMWKWKMYTPEYTDIHLETWHRHNYVSMLGLSVLLLLFVTDGTAPIYPAQSAFDYSLNPPSIAWHTDAYTWPNWVNERFLFFEFDSNFCGWRQCRHITLQIGSSPFRTKLPRREIQQCADNNKDNNRNNEAKEAYECTFGFRLKQIGRRSFRVYVLV